MMLHIDLREVRYVSKIPWESFKKDGFNLPNSFSYLRMLATMYPAYLLVTGFHNPSVRGWATFWFVLIAFTDWIDGFLARKLNMQSEWGAFIDPIADKLLVTVALGALCIGYFGHPYGWIVIGSAVFFMLRELILAWQINKARDTIPRPTWSGKVKTTLQFVMIGAWMAPSMPNWLIAFSTCSALIATLISWIDYYRLYVSDPRSNDM